MQFLLLAHDGTDAEAPVRRQQARGDHLAAMSKLKASGHFLYGGALLDDAGNMIGSAIVFDFPDRAALDETIARDPYTLGKVWQRVEIKNFRAAQVE